MIEALAAVLLVGMLACGAAVLLLDDLLAAVLVFSAFSFCSALLFAVLGAGLSGSAVFGINTGFRGDTLSALVNEAQMQLLLVDATLTEEVERTL